VLRCPSPLRRRLRETSRARELYFVPLLINRRAKRERERERGGGEGRALSRIVPAGQRKAVHSQLRPLVTAFRSRKVNSVAKSIKCNLARLTRDRGPLGDNAGPIAITGGGGRGEGGREGASAGQKLDPPVGHLPLAGGGRGKVKQRTATCPRGGWGGGAGALRAAELPDELCSPGCRPNESTYRIVSLKLNKLPR